VQVGRVASARIGLVTRRITVRRKRKEEERRRKEQEGGGAGGKKMPECGISGGGCDGF